MTATRWRWNGLCPTGFHGLDFEGQACDLCARRTEVRGDVEEPLIAHGAGPAAPRRVRRNIYQKAEGRVVRRGRR